MLSRFAIALVLTLCAGCGASDADDGIGPGPDGGGGGDGLEDMLSAQEIALRDEINAQRAAMGLGEVVLRETLICAAQAHAGDVGPLSLCSHDGTDGSDPTVRVDRCGGGGWTGEIIACGQGDPELAVAAWISSPGHNMIMFGPTKREIGVGMVNNYWVAIFDD